MGVIRNTYGELKSTTIKTWQEWFPDEIMPITYDSPIRGRMLLDCRDGTMADWEVLFVSMDKDKDVRKLKSMEVTMFWLNEASELPKSAYDMSTGRVGRYPAMRLGGATRSGVVMDTNAMETDHWYYNLAEVLNPSNHAFFRQPPAILKHGDTWVPNDGSDSQHWPAENIENLPGGFQYYMNQVPGKSEDWIKAFLAAQYTAIFTGKPMYPSYNDRIHCVPEVMQMKKLPLYLGFDFGLTPACVLFQVSPRGQLVIHDEVVSMDSGLRQFLRDAVVPILMTEYAGFASYLGFGDLAGTQRAQTDEQTCFDLLREFQIPAHPVASNDLLPRIAAVEEYLLKMVDGMPGLILTPKCKYLRLGFQGKYCRERVQVTEERYKDVPVKNEFSHIAEALQYGCLGVKGRIRRADAITYPIPEFQVADSRAGY